MARANLAVQAEVRDAFVSAQSSDVRSLKLRVQGEEIVLDRVVDAAGNVEEDFDALTASLLVHDVACFVLFNITEAAGGAEAGGGGKQWLFVCWVPDTARVRDKMLYSSSKDDLKKTLGVGHFVSGDVSASTADEVSWSAYQAAVSARTDGSVAEVLTAGEKTVREEEAASRQEATGGKSSAMGALPFGFPTDVLQAFTAFSAAGEGAANWLELELRGEEVALAGSQSVACVDSAVLPSAARFIVYRPQQQPSSVLLVYFCPEDAPVRLKMTMSSAKAAVSARLQESGAKVTAGAEVREIGDLVGEIRQALGGAAAEDAGAGVASVLQFASVSPKPARPGRGKARVSKFVADA